MKKVIFILALVASYGAVAFPTDSTTWDINQPVRSTCLTTTNASNDIDTVTGTTVNADSASGQKVLGVAATTDAVANDWIIINPGGAREEVGQIASVQAGTSFTLVGNLTFTHTAVQADAVRRTNRLGPMTADKLYTLVCHNGSGTAVGCKYVVGPTTVDVGKVTPMILWAGNRENFYATGTNLYISVVPFVDNQKVAVCPH